MSTSEGGEIVQPGGAPSPRMAPPLLECFPLTPYPLRIVPASSRRDWMDAVPNGHAYRCLPLAIANAYGWHLLSPCDLEMTWSGGDATSQTTIRATDGYAHVEDLADSHFGRGVVTFHLGHIFRTSPGWQLLATGPFNAAKPGIAPLTGVIETEWLPYPFTMNWQFTGPGVAHFAKDEPVCHIFPVPQGVLSQVEPVIRDPREEPELVKQFFAWSEARQNFTALSQEAWQRHYFRGEMPASDAKAPSHEHKLRLKPPIDTRKR